MKRTLENCGNCKRYMLNGGKCVGVRSRHCVKWKALEGTKQ